MKLSKLYIVFIIVVLLLSFTSADYKFENMSGSELMHLYSSNGNLSILGNLSATNFFGDGSGLTGINGELNSTGWNRSGTDVFLANSGDRVGIGTDIPSSTFEVQNNVFTQAIFKGTESTRTGEINILNSAGQGMTLGVTGPTYASADVSSAVIAPTGGLNAISLGASRGHPKLTVISTTGNVGIGITNPSEKLDINGSLVKIKISDPLTSGSSFKAGMVQSGGVVYPGLWFNQATPSISNIALWAQTSSTILNSPSSPLYFRIGNAGRMVMSSNGLAINTVNSESGVGNGLIVGSGKVGIGTSSPQGLLGFLAEESNTPKIVFAGDINLTVSTLSQSGAGLLGIGANSKIDSSGNFVSTNSIKPTSLIVLGNYSSNNGIRFKTSSTGNPSDRMIITSDGKVGIGTTNPQGLLDLRKKSTNGDVSIYIHNYESTISSIDETASIKFSHGNDGGTGYVGAKIVSGKEGDFESSPSQVKGNLQFYTARGSTNTQVEAMRIDGSGNVGIGTASPQSKFNLNGSYNLAGGLTFGDGDSGFYEVADDNFRIAISGVGKYEISSLGIGSTNQGYPWIPLETPTSSNPVFVPWRNDDNTGIGWAAADQLSLIAGGVEMARLTTTDATIYGDLNVTGAIYGSSGSTIVQGTGTANKLTKWSATGDAIVDSAVSDDSSAVVIEI